jgi:hypothetical protein
MFSIDPFYNSFDAWGSLETASAAEIRDLPFGVVFLHNPVKTPFIERV